VTTGRDDGGIHYWYRAPALDPPPNSHGEHGRGVAAGIDIRGAGDGAGGMVLAPPSWHHSGRRYAWRDRLPLADLPPWLRALASPQRTTPAPGGIPDGTGKAAGRRPATRQVRDGLGAPPEVRARTWAVSALAGEAAGIAAMAPGTGRSNALNGAAYKFGRLAAGGVLSADDVRQVLTDAGIACGLDDRTRKGDGRGSAARTVTSGMTAGAAYPRTVADICQHLQRRPGAA
jgi:hypothetical protein